MGAAVAVVAPMLLGGAGGGMLGGMLGGSMLSNLIGGILGGGNLGGIGKALEGFAPANVLNAATSLEAVYAGFKRAKVIRGLDHKWCQLGIHSIERLEAGADEALEILVEEITAD